MALREVAELDELDAAIKAARDAKDKKRLLADRAAFLRNLATKMDHGIPEFRAGGRIFTAVWSVTGNAPHKADEARAWLLSNGVVWGGSAKSLCTKIAQLLEKGIALPPGHFGLYVERTVQIADDGSSGTAKSPGPTKDPPKEKRRK